MLMRGRAITMRRPLPSRTMRSEQFEPNLFYVFADAYLTFILRACSFFTKTDIICQNPGNPAFLVHSQVLTVSAATCLPITLHPVKTEPFDPYSNNFIQ